MTTSATFNYDDGTVSEALAQLTGNDEAPFDRFAVRASVLARSYDDGARVNITRGGEQSYAEELGAAYIVVAGDDVTVLPAAVFEALYGLDDDAPAPADDGRLAALESAVASLQGTVDALTQQLTALPPSTTTEATSGASAGNASGSTDASAASTGAAAAPAPGVPAGVDLGTGPGSGPGV